MEPCDQLRPAKKSPTHGTANLPRPLETTTAPTLAKRAAMLAAGRTMCLRGLVRCLACLAIGWPVTVLAEPAEIEFFREKIEPVLQAQCYSCHSADADEVRGGLRLDTRSELLRGGDGGPVVVAGKSADSRLVQALRHEGGLAMPPEKPKLPDGVIADFVHWVDGGAPDPRGDVLPSESARMEEARRHWAFQPVIRHQPPPVRDTGWGAMPVDAFVLAKLEERSWRPAPAASRAELIRRVTFDVIGLPPTPDEIAAFVDDPWPDAYARLVDRLLRSPHYGEHFAQHWLDLVRFAESEGFEYDREIPGAWRFRDYVINSLNADKPFDQFLSEQIAGDEIDASSQECLAASIFHRLGAVRRNAGNPEIALSRNEVLTERTDIIGAAFLGLTVGCARCHNHKLEPISQKDYYSLQAYFAATEEHNILLASAEEQAAWEAATKRAKDEIDALRAKARTVEPKEKEQLVAQIETLEDQMPGPLATIPSTHNDWEKCTPIHVLRRGVWENKAEPVRARPPSVLVADTFPELSGETRNPRTQLARWLASPEHPLTARVIVNRLWQQHFGVGLVKTANDFGLKGDRPSHPELLDWLASELVAQGWGLKSIHRTILLSNTYQQSSRSPHQAAQREADPENRLLGHFPRRRLSGEEIRDAMLCVSGRINYQAGGPSVIVPVDAELVQLLYRPSQWLVTRDSRQHDRRGIYLVAKRNLRLPFLESLDAPALQTSCAKRDTSTHPPQALELLNGPFSNELAGALASRLEQEAGGDYERIVVRAFQLALGRLPRADETQRSLEFLREQPLSEFTLALFNLNEFLYVP